MNFFPSTFYMYWEPYFKSLKTENLGRVSGTWEFGAGSVPRNPESGVGSVLVNLGIHSDLSQNERESLSDHASVFRNIQK